VTDYISIWKFPVFNIADIAIFLGVVGLVFFEIQKIKTHEESKPPKT
jgi:lipoprotein signal peptidase